MQAQRTLTCRCSKPELSTSTMRTPAPARAVILIHSSASGYRQWRQLTESLQDRYRIIAVNLFGYGKTSPWSLTRPLTAADQGKLVAAVAALAQEPVILVGHSLGGAVALEAAAMLADRVRLVIAFEPILFGHLQAHGPASVYDEIAHIALGHGLASIQGSRLTEIAAEFAMDAGAASGGDVAAFTGAFGDSISELAKTIVISGYSQSYEFQADLEARRILASSSYDPNALTKLIGRLPSRDQENAAGFAVTHPEPASRIEALQKQPIEPSKKETVKQVKPLPKEGDNAGGGSDPVSRLYARLQRFEAMRSLF